MFSFKGLMANCLMRLFGLLPIQDKVVFCAFRGKMYGDNPRFIFEEMVRQFPQKKYVWLMQKNIDIPHATVVNFFSIKALYHLATSMIWIDCSRKQRWIHKRKKQYYVQTWHGDVCIKMIEKDAERELPEDYILEAKHDSSITDLMLSGSDFRTNNFRNAFWYDGEILEEGTPKSVIYHENPKNIHDNVLAFFGLKLNTKIALYCPTFRADGELTAYNIDYKHLLENLNNKWGGDWVVIVRLHPKINELQNRIQYSPKIINGSNYSSTDELVVACDLLITDYSGCMFNGLEANKIVILYASDIDTYSKNERGFYFDIRNLPFPLADDNDTLSKIIMEFDEEPYFKQFDKLRETIGFHTDKESTIRIVKYINEQARRKR